jgi:hypothetical protein
VSSLSIDAELLESCHDEVLIAAREASMLEDEFDRFALEV